MNTRTCNGSLCIGWRFGYDSDGVGWGDIGQIHLEMCLPGSGLVLRDMDGGGTGYRGGTMTDLIAMRTGGP